MSVFLLPLEYSHPPRNGGEGQESRINYKIKDIVSVEHLPVSDFLTAKSKGDKREGSCFCPGEKTDWKGKNS